MKNGRTGQFSLESMFYWLTMYAVLLAVYSACSVPIKSMLIGLSTVTILLCIRLTSLGGKTPIRSFEISYSFFTLALAMSASLIVYILFPASTDDFDLLEAFGHVIYVLFLHLILISVASTISFSIAIRIRRKVKAAYILVYLNIPGVLLCLYLAVFFVIMFFKDS
jgi:hypothetical protein